VCVLCWRLSRKLMIPKFEAFHNTVTSKNYTTVIKRPMSLKEMQVCTD